MRLASTKFLRTPKEVPIAALHWPEGKRCAVVLSFDVDAEAAMLALDQRNRRRLGVLSAGTYGPVTGIPRILSLLADLDLKATFFVPGFNAQVHPHTIEEIAKAGHEIGHHGYLHLRFDTLTVSQAKRELERGIVALRNITGADPRGFRAPWWEMDRDTPSLLCQYGFLYDSSLMSADNPYLLQTTKGSIIELPVSFILDDWEQFGYVSTPQLGSAIEDTEKVYRLWVEEYDALLNDHATFILTLHPWLIGRSSRMRLLRRVLEHILRSKGAWITTGLKLAEHCNGFQAK